jgi:hypothetical protein
MYTTLRNLALIGLLAVPAPLAAQTGTGDIPRTSGKVLVLDNDQVLEGEIVREGDRYCIRRQFGETWVPVARARMLCDSLDELYRSMRSRTNLRDPDERLRLARWCYHRGLREQALEEVEAILQSRPQSAEAQRLQKSLLNPPAEPSPPAPPPREEEPAEAPPSFAVTLETLALFSSKVQPILMNKCANCHAAGRGGSFKLARIFSDSASNRRATQANIAAVMGYINRDQWASSAFLIKSISIHGGPSQPPLQNRQTPTYQALEAWVQQMVADLPREASPATARTAAEAPAPLSERTVFAAMPLPGEKEPAQSTAPAAKPAQPSSPADPFDPALFNQQSGRGP